MLDFARTLLTQMLEFVTLSTERLCADLMSEVFYAGDDAGAKDTVRRLAGSIGFEPVDGGPLANARYLEPLGMLNIWFGYVGGRGTNIAPRWDTAASVVPVAV